MRDGLIIWDRFVPSMCDSAFEYCEYINISQPETALGQKAISGCQGKWGEIWHFWRFCELKKYEDCHPVDFVDKDEYKTDGTLILSVASAWSSYRQHCDDDDGGNNYVEEEDYRTKWWMLLGHRVTNEVGKRIILSTGSGSDYQIPSRTIATFSLPSYISYIIVIIILRYHQCGFFSFIIPSKAKWSDCTSQSRFITGNIFKLKLLFFLVVSMSFPWRNRGKS